METQNEIENKTQVFKYTQPFPLEQGGVLYDLEIAYTTSGKLNASKSNVVWVCHALTANANPQEWWPGLVGNDRIINPEQHFIVCANILGSCYGTTGPLHNSTNQKPHFSDFPFITVRDLVNAHILLANHLGIDNIELIIGGSLGGQQALEWSIIEPERIKKMVLVATNAHHSPYGIAFNESQRLAIFADETYHKNIPEGGKNGLKAARSIALISYRTYHAYNSTQKEDDVNKTEDFNAASYQQYQGQKLVDRFNAYSYVTLSKTMDSHNVGRNRISVKQALNRIRAKTICIGIESDVLFPPIEQRFLSEHIPVSTYVQIDSSYGHDGFLIEAKKLTEIIKPFFR
jgi:homoserine O-acetyltransferase/O-succinyltransferase